MADWLLPTEASQYLDVLQQLKERDTDNATMFVSNPINPVTGTLRFVRGAQFILQEYDGAIWNDKVLSVASGGTGSTNLDDVKGSLNLGTMSNQNYDNVNITGGAINVGAVTSAVMEIKRATPYLSFYDLNGGPDSKRWQLHVANHTLSLTVTNDINSLATPIFDIVRSGMTVTHFRLSIPLTIGRGLIDTAGQPMNIQTAAGILITHPTSNISFNLYLDSGGASWKYAEGGMGGWLIHRNAQAAAELNFFGSPYNSGGAGAEATIFNKVFSLNPSGDASLMRNMTVGGSLTAASVGTSGASSSRSDSASVAYYLFSGVGGQWPGLMFMTPGGAQHIHLTAAGPNDFRINQPDGYQWYFINRTFYPSHDNVFYLGTSGNRWAYVYAHNMHSIYFRSSTGSGFIFDETASRGMIRSGSALLLQNDGDVHLRINGADGVRVSLVNPFGVVASINSHTIPVGNNGYWLGHNSTYFWYYVASYNGVLTGSDFRIKENVKDEVLGLNFINRLKPVQYNMRENNAGEPNRTRHGFVAQDILKVLDNLKVEFEGIHPPRNEGDIYSMNYSELIGPIVKAIQELSRKVDEYGSRNHD